jgi:hypothetical protein
MTFLAGTLFFLFLPTDPVNTLILETALVNLRASTMAIRFSQSIYSVTCGHRRLLAVSRIHSAEIYRKPF